MPNFTSNTYQMKWKVLTFTNKISRYLSKPQKKFAADITYGILASGSCLLTDVAHQLHEPSKKFNTVDRLSRHLEKGIPASAAVSYLRQVKKLVPDEPVVHIDDSDVVKKGGSKSESLGTVRDGSESTSTKKCLQKRLSCHRGLCPYTQCTSCQHFFQSTLFFTKTICCNCL